ncbi:MAG: glycosyltransferase family 39 protein [Flavobacteriales bacterium]|nr:glycosyltransferase family 39 protein [Flavobacteriales bacterium]
MEKALKYIHHSSPFEPLYLFLMSSPGSTYRLLFPSFLIGWTLLNLFQAAWVELAHDEAYYWTWSLFPAWGYIEHPPMVALWIKAGTSIFHGELGVRFLTVIASTLVIWLWARMLSFKDPLLLIALISSNILLNAGGFVTAPDSPLGLAVTCYYMALRKYMEAPTPKAVLFMVLSITFVMYSKYHGAIVILLTVMANPSWLMRRSFWLMTLASVVLYLPHLWWLNSRGADGIGFALNGRFEGTPNIMNVLDYLSGQAIVMGPLSGLLIWYAALRHRRDNPYERTLKFILAGIFLFFLGWSIQGKMEANWTASALFPLIYLAHGFLSERQDLRKVFLWIAGPVTACLLTVRLMMFFPDASFGPMNEKLSEFHGWKTFAGKIMDRAGGRPVVAGGYQLASKLWYYGGEQVMPLNISRRPNQFDLTNGYDELEGRSVLLVDQYLLGGDTMVSPTGIPLRVQDLHAFHDWRAVKISAVKIASTFHKDRYAGATLSIVIPPGKVIMPPGPEDHPIFISADFRDIEHNELITWDASVFDVDRPWQDTVVHRVRIPTPEKRGVYMLSFHLSELQETRWASSPSYEVLVK